VGGIDSITLIGAVDRTSSNSSKQRKSTSVPVTRKANASRQPAKAAHLPSSNYSRKTTKSVDTQYYSRKKLDSHAVVRRAHPELSRP
jgi:hypothetical protein